MTPSPSDSDDSDPPDIGDVDPLEMDLGITSPIEKAAEAIDGDAETALEKAREAARSAISDRDLVTGEADGVESSPGHRKYSSDMEIEASAVGTPSFGEFERDLVEISKDLAARPKRYIRLDNLTIDQLGFLQIVVGEMQCSQVELFDWDDDPCRHAMYEVEFIGHVDSLVMAVKHADEHEHLRGGIIKIIRRKLADQAGEE